jgi:hypothetical protein
MSRWTNKREEVSRISEVAQKLSGNMIVLIELESGESIEGVLRSLSMGNNASTALNDGRWLYYGNFDLQTLDGQLHNIDMIAVRSIINIWSEKSSEYEKAGLIQIIR